mmetsp:Transcript_74558/g.208263  ORF Transcript_74558/g.208263 Transcript_74558/m.208263 type:complete len:102 (-) Transcript_74558:3-308(-)
MPLRDDHGGRPLALAIPAKCSFSWGSRNGEASAAEPLAEGASDLVRALHPAGSSGRGRSAKPASEGGGEAAEDAIPRWGGGPLLVPRARAAKKGPCLEPGG